MIDARTTKGDGGAMNWTETTIGAAAVFGTGMMMAQRAAEKSLAFLISAGGAPDAAQMTLGQTRTIVIAGVIMTPSDFIVMLILTAVSSAVAASMKFKNLRAAGLNLALGVLFGYLGAHLLVVMSPVPNDAIFGLAPAFALIAAKIARGMIKDDDIVNAIFAAVFRKK